jgi:tetratricopeptide (TPR) repeat protein
VAPGRRYVFEILRELKEHQFIGIRPDGSWISTREIREMTVPRSLKELISTRIADLTDDERRLLELAACAGFEFEPRMLARAGGWGVVPVLKLIADLQNESRLIRNSERGFCFDEHLVQETVYRELGEERRTECHRALVDAIARVRDREGLTGASAVDFCHHAIRGGCPEAALPHLIDALDHLTSSHLTGPAVDLIERALGIDGLLTGTTRLEILSRFAELLDRLARRGREQEVLFEMRALAKSLRDRRTQARAMRFLGRHYQAVCKYSDACTALRSAAALASLSGDVEEEAAAIGMLAIVHTRLGEFEEAATYQETAVQLAAECGSPHARDVHRADLGIVFHGLGRYEEARRHHEEFLALAGSSERPTDEMRHSECLARTLVAQGDYARALEQLERSLAVAFEIGDRQGEGVAYLSLGFVNRDLGRMDEAERLLEQARCLFRQMGLVAGEAAAHYGLGRIAEDYGLTDRAETLYGESLEISREIGTKGALLDSLVARGRLRSSLGKVKRATRDLTEARELALRIRRPDPLVLAESYLALVEERPGRSAEEVLAGNPGIPQVVRMEVHHVLHRTTGKPEHLDAARALLNGLLDRAPPELKESMRRNVPLHREIYLALEN